MAAATADRNTTVKELGRSASLRVAASTQIFKGTLVRPNATGFLIPADDAAGGGDASWLAEENVDNSAGADGDLRCRCRKGVVLVDNGGGVVQASIGAEVSSEDDQTVDLTSVTTNDHVVGLVDDFSDGGQVVVHLKDS